MTVADAVMKPSDHTIFERLAGSRLMGDFGRAFGRLAGGPVRLLPGDAFEWSEQQQGTRSPLIVPVLHGTRVVAWLSVAPASQTAGVVPMDRRNRGQPPRAAAASGSHLQEIGTLLRVFAEHLAIVANQILLQELANESPVIVRVKAFVSEHLGDDLHLRDVAQHAHMSPSYFCKLFHRSVGLVFTEYVSRQRIERARLRLLDRHVRVSEIAFEVGFQSLSQFNRMFKRVTGWCPTDYRERLVVGAGSPASQVTTAPVPERYSRPGVPARPRARRACAAAGG